VLALPRRQRFIGDISFQELTQNPYAATAFSKVQQQLTKEGANSSDVQAAQTAFTNSYNQLASVASGLSGQNVIDAAQSYVMAGNTILGAAQTIGGLISSAGKMPPATVIQMFTGTLIGVAIAAGAVSAGIGAAVVGAVDGLLQVLQGAGLFGSPPAGTQICPGYYCQGAAFTVQTQGPSGVLGCCCAFPLSNSQAQTSPSSPNWRAFPEAGVSADLPWYTTNASTFTWGGIEFGVPATLGSAQPTRPIDHAFPQLRTLECNVSQALGTPLGGFMSAFFSAWKANAAYALNGLKAQDDAQVLLHTLRLWNRAHASTSTTSLSPDPSGVLLGPTGTCLPGDPIVPLYAQLLITSAIDDVSSSDLNLVDSSGNLIVNMGEPYGGYIKLNPGGPGGGIRMNPGLPGILALPPAPMSTGKKVAIGAGVVLVGAAGVGVYSVVTQQSVGFLADTLADRVTSAAGRVGGLAREASRFPRKRKR